MSMIIIMGIWSTLGNIPAGWLALIGTLFGGVGLKALEAWLGKNATKQTERRDLNQEIKDLVARVDQVEEEVSQWRMRAYAAEEQVALLRVIVINMGGQLPETTVKEAQ